jgi:hypothetical protein
MLRVIFDTNIYGFLLKQTDRDILERNMVGNKEFIVYGYAPIRIEIRNVPTTTFKSRKSRLSLLEMYDKITGKHVLKNSEAINVLAKKYYFQYIKSGGIYVNETSIHVDFLIVACASYYGLDVIYSADNKTLMSDYAKLAYSTVNCKANLKTPKFVRFEQLLEEFGYGKITRV